MRILFDQGTPVAIREALQGHLVRTAYEEGWSRLENGELLRMAERAGFQVLVTTDAHLPDQQSLQGRQLAVIILSKNRWVLIQRHLAEISAAVASARPGTFSVVQIRDSK